MGEDLGSNVVKGFQKKVVKMKSLLVFALLVCCSVFTLTAKTVEETDVLNAETDGEMVRGIGLLDEFLIRRETRDLDKQKNRDTDKNSKLKRKDKVEKKNGKTSKSKLKKRKKEGKGRNKKEKGNKIGKRKKKKKNQNKKKRKNKKNKKRKNKNKKRKNKKKKNKK